MYYLRLFPESVTHLKLIQVPRIFDKSKEDALKIWLTNKQVGSFQMVSRSNASCTMYIVFNARH